MMALPQYEWHSYDASAGLAKPKASAIGSAAGEALDVAMERAKERRTWFESIVVAVLMIYGQKLEAWLSRKCFFAAF